ncbi:MAG: hypothetical protein ACOC2A_01170 [Halanaeroarchaeum sp.]
MEFFAVMACHILFYVLFIGPYLRDTYGFEQQALDGEGYRLSLHQVLSPRGIILLISGVAVTMLYMYFRPRFSGMTPEEYWTNE